MPNLTGADQLGAASEHENEAGFTIIELLMVIIILGTLAGLAISSFNLYKMRAYNTTALTDLKNSLISLQTYLDDNEAYPTCVTAACAASMAGLTTSPGVHLAFASTGGETGTVIACYPGRGNLAYYRPSVVDTVVSVPIAGCGS